MKVKTIISFIIIIIAMDFNFQHCIVFFSFILTVRRSCFGTSHDGATYSFGYAVEAVDTGVITQHWEERRGEIVRGEYSLLDADGRVRVVDYQVEGNGGFRAVVTFRPPGGQRFAVGHLEYPRQYRSPIQLQRPVSLITPDLFYGRTKTHPQHLSLY